MLPRSLLLLGLLSTAAFAEEPAPVEVRIVNHQFVPTDVEIPAGQRIKLVVINEDDSAEEFEGEDFKAEKIVKGKSQITLMVGPFQPREYRFVGEFHEDTAKGKLIVK